MWICRASGGHRLVRQRSDSQVCWHHLTDRVSGVPRANQNGRRRSWRCTSGATRGSERQSPGQSASERLRKFRNRGACSVSPSHVAAVSHAFKSKLKPRVHDLLQGSLTAPMPESWTCPQRLEPKVDLSSSEATFHISSVNNDGCCFETKRGMSVAKPLLKLAERVLWGLRETGA